LLLVAAVLVIAALALGACGESSEGGGGEASPSAEASPVAGGTYNYPLTANPVSIEPVNAQESEGMQVAHQVFEGLAGYVMNDKGEMVAEPVLAESWETTDSQTWTFHLKQGVMYQAPVSREVVAQDFVDSWNRATNPDNGSYTSYILAPIQGADDGGYWDSDAGLTGVKAIDDYTLEVTLRYPFAEFPQTLGHPVAAVTPVDYIDEIGAKDYNRKPVGTGPFMVKEWKNNQYIDLVKNPDYWDTENAAYLDEVMCKIILESSTSWLEFQKGNVDYTTVPPGQWKVAEAMPEVQSGEWTAKAWPSLSTMWVGFNMNNPVVGGDENLELRKAMVLSADQANIISIVKEGAAVPATGIVCEGIPGYQPNQSPYLYDPEAAKEVVAGLGDVPTLQYWYNTDEGHQKMGEILQAGWEAVGLDVELSNFEWGTFLDKLAKSEKGGADSSQVFRMGWIADYPSMDNFLYPLFHSSQSATMYTFYANPEFDDLVVQARQTTDETQRTNLYLQAEKLMLEDAPCIPIYYYRDQRVSNNRLGGFVHDPMAQTHFWKMWVK
jgi:peptide/nickel transport system substrate-binding protein/oligopeptide transport system substrate-binding protein